MWAERHDQNIPLWRKILLKPEDRLIKIQSNACKPRIVWLAERGEQFIHRWINSDCGYVGKLMGRRIGSV
jgi:hypothetical protein